jgi:hypothetical protein
MTSEQRQQMIDQLQMENAAMLEDIALREMNEPIVRKDFGHGAVQRRVETHEMEQGVVRDWLARTSVVDAAQPTSFMDEQQQVHWDEWARAIACQEAKTMGEICADVIGEHTGKLRRKQDDMRAELDNLKAEVAALRVEVEELRAEVEQRNAGYLG